MKVGNGRRIRVIVADDHNVVRAGLRMLLRCEESVELVGEAASGREVIDLARSLCPEVVLMDLAMETLNGVEATRQILRDCPKTKVIALSCYADVGLVKKALAAGAAGYLVKHTSFEALVDAIHEVQKGHAYFSPEIARELCRRLKWQAEGRDAEGAGSEKENEPELSRREAEVLQRIAEGQTSKAMAIDLGLSLKTVEKHRLRLKRKLNLHSTADLVRYAASTRVIAARPVALV